METIELQKINDNDIEFVSDNEQAEMEQLLSDPDCKIIEKTETLVF